MRRILVIMLLVLTAWVFLPGTARAHGQDHAMPAADDCPHCTAMVDADRADPAMPHPCHQGFSCPVHVLPLTTAAITPRAHAPLALPPDRRAELPSAQVARDLPPPRS